MRKMSMGVAALFVAGLLGLSCADQSGLKLGGGTGGAGSGAKGGQAGGGVAGGSGGAIATGGVSAGAGGAIATGGVQAGSGGTIATGGVGAGGTGGSGGGSGGSDGCYQGVCVLLLPACPGVFQVNPDSPCGCRMCVLTPDAGVAKDASGPDALPSCPPVACPALGCPVYLPNPDPCGCPICAPSSNVDAGTARDGGKTDAPPNCRIACPALACPGGYLPNPDPCTCPVCAPTPDAAVAKDAGGETSPASCTGLDECTCFATSGCAPIAEPCWCPFPQCNPSAACICGGGRFVACAPRAIATCAGAKARATALCPALSDTTYDMCTWSVPACVTKCLAEVNSCNDIACALCDPCDCGSDHFETCYQQCVSTLAH